MQTIQTGYQPDGALGALYAGQNAANAQSMNDEELAKLFLANQLSQQTYAQNEQINPLEVIRKQNENRVGGYDAQYADAKRASPSYIPNALAGFEGQMKSQIAAGNNAMALQPFKTAAEQAGYETEQNKQGVLWTLQDIDKKLAAGGATDENGNIVPMNKNQIAFMQNKRAELTNQLQTTPEWTGKNAINEDDNATKLEIARINAEAMGNRAAMSATPRTKAPTTAEAAMTQQIMANAEMDENEKHQLLLQIFNAKQQGKNASGEDISLMLTPEGKYKLAPRAVNPPVAQTLPTGPKANITTPQTPEDWNAAWSKLSKGQSMTGLDGKTYTKK